MSGKHLQGHVPAERDLLGLKDDSHAASPDFAEDPVLPQLLGDRAFGLIQGDAAGNLFRLRADALQHHQRRKKLADFLGQPKSIPNGLLEGVAEQIDAAPGEFHARANAEALPEHSHEALGLFPRLFDS